MMELLLQKLATHRLQADEIGGTLNVRAGVGLMARAVNIDPTTTLEWLGGRPVSTRIHDAAAWASGIATALAEPARSDARSWSFVEAAGSIYPTIEGEGFGRGVVDATGEPPWVQPLGDSDLTIAWILRLRRGLRPLTAPHVEDWSVTPDRIVAAGRSLLFHATQGRGWAPTDQTDVVQLRVGDGHDAARLLIAEDFFFGDVDARWRFAIPHPDVLLAVRTPDRLEALRSAAATEAGAVTYPLHTRCWMFRAGKPVLAEDA